MSIRRCIWYLTCPPATTQDNWPSCKTTLCARKEKAWTWRNHKSVTRKSLIFANCVLLHVLYVLLLHVVCFTCVVHYNPNSFHFAPHCMIVHARITKLPLCRMHPFVRVVRELNKYTLIIMISDKELNILVCFKQWHMRRPLGMD